MNGVSASYAPWSTRPPPGWSPATRTTCPSPNHPDASAHRMPLTAHRGKATVPLPPPPEPPVSRSYCLPDDTARTPIARPALHRQRPDSPGTHCAANVWRCQRVPPGNRRFCWRYKPPATRQPFPWPGNGRSLRAPQRSLRDRWSRTVRQFHLPMATSGFARLMPDPTFRPTARRGTHQQRVMAATTVVSADAWQRSV
ncbi:hypothetical protein D3C81_1108680 [compost metagenome]